MPCPFFIWSSYFLQTDAYSSTWGSSFPLTCNDPPFFDFLCMLLVQNQNSHPLLNAFMFMSPSAKSVTSDRLYGRAMHAILVLFRSFLISYLSSVLWYSKSSFVLCQKSPLPTRARQLL